MENKSSQFKFAIPLALLFGALFFWLQQSGVLSSFSFGGISYGTAFVIGVVASLSTCMAVVGGLVLSMSTAFAKSGDKFRPQLLFHAARIASFFVLGGVIGVIGRAFTLSISASIVLNIVIAGVMIALGLNLLEIKFARRLQIGMPRFVSRRALNIFDLEHKLAPLLAGVATFFLPCGFTQAMQIYTLKSGSFISGGLTMLFFALGTLPMLALVSFSPAVFKSENKKDIFFKTAGLIVLLFASLNLYSALVLLGILPPVLNL
jgi:uncharacterized protein